MSDEPVPPEQKINQSQPSEQKSQIAPFFLKLIIGGISVYIVIMLGFIILTGTREANDSMRRKEIKQNLTQIGIALEQYAAQEESDESSLPSK
ncbi:hypothetical protein [Gimesia chilikensis]|jgi:hypothetical protein|uniref:hypothetical protein n=1 Tax=Gimesia chilikensis TaxID=2605989 RepID=UPI00118972AA|nr:hypothetical protein [Gimesia chilikensis]QDT85725.1 hypothetical protein MalM14_33950 [Gimesia chilikensis]